jgi:hypothetical protein
VINLIKALALVTVFASGWIANSLYSAPPPLRYTAAFGQDEDSKRIFFENISFAYYLGEIDEEAGTPGKHAQEASDCFRVFWASWHQD